MKPAASIAAHLLHAVLVQLHASGELEVAAAAQAAGVGPGQRALLGWEGVVEQAVWSDEGQGRHAM